MGKVYDHIIPCVHCGTPRRVAGECASEKEYYHRAKEAECGFCGKPIGKKVKSKAS